MSDDKKERLKIIIKKLLKSYMEEMTSTGTGASFSGGEGEQYATPKAFAKHVNKKKAEVLGYRLIPKNQRYKGKSFDVNKYWEEKKK